MGRYHDWNSAWTGIMVYLIKEGFDCTGKDLDRVVRKFCRSEDFKGSRTDGYIFVGQNFNSFKKFLKSGISDVMPDNLSGDTVQLFMQMNIAKDLHTDKNHHKRLREEYESAKYKFKNHCIRIGLNPVAVINFISNKK